MGDNLIDQAVFLGFQRGHIVVALGVQLDLLQRLAGVIAEHVIHLIADIHHVLSVDLDIGGLAGKAAALPAGLRSRQMRERALELLSRKPQSRRELTRKLNEWGAGPEEADAVCDRMEGLDITPEKLEAEKRVVIEEFRQRYLNQPYGDQPMLLRALAYKVHPYRWATIGLTPDHIAGATLDDVQAFYRTHYHPSNAILSVSADFDEERILDLAEKWFAPLADRTVTPQPIPREPQQEAPRRETVERDVPATTLSMAFHMGVRTSQDFYTADLVSDLLSGGDSSRLYKHLVQEQRLLASVNAYISGDVDPGLFVFTGQLLPDTTPEQAEAAFRAEIEALQSVPASDYEVEKVKNKFEANTLFGELNVMNKAMNLGFYEMLGDLPLINGEVAAYRAVTTGDILAFSRRTFRPENCSILIYKAKK